MNRLIKKALVFSIALALLLAITACSKQDGTAVNANGTYVRATAKATADEYEMIPFLKNYAQYKYDGHINVLYLVCTTYAEYFPNSHAVWEPILAEYNISIDLLGPPAYSDESLLSTLESSLQSGKYDIVVLYPITPQAVTPYLDEAWNTYHVPILAYAFSPDTGCGHYYLGTSYYEAGVTVGKAIVEYVNDNAAYYNTLKTIPVAIYKSTGATEQYFRIRGAWDVLAADGRFSLIQEYEANGDAQCLAATETVLMTHPDVEVFLTQIDSDIPGTYQVLTGGLYKVSEYASVWGNDATGVVCGYMSRDGVDGFVQGSSLIDHYETADALIELVPILVGAAKKGEKINFTQEEVDFMGTWASRHYVAVTPKNIDRYYNP
jgi:ABC-type sugar transport system substrate-binding protein